MSRGDGMATVPNNRVKVKIMLRRLQQATHKCELLQQRVLELEATTSLSRKDVATETHEDDEWDERDSEHSPSADQLRESS